MRYDVAILGGGLAGCAAGIHLSRKGLNVLLLEKQKYPAHRLCGEFLSIEVQGQFDRLGIAEVVQSSGARPIRHVQVTTQEGASFEADLPGTAIGISRYTLDALLASQARKAGVDIREGSKVKRVEGNLREGFAVHTDNAAYEARITLGAYGKRSTLDRSLARPFLRRISPFVAFKAHYDGIDLGERIELHAFPGGYAGLAPIEGNRVNVCWVMRDDQLKSAGGDPEVLIARSLYRNPGLAERFGKMQRITDSFLAVAQLQFTRKACWERDIAMIGDAAGMVAPMCGDGMAMALRSAELVSPGIVAYLEGRITADELRTGYDRAWRREFGVRMRLGRWMHHAYCRPAVAHMGVVACNRAPVLGRWLIRRTRG